MPKKKVSGCAVGLAGMDLGEYKVVVCLDGMTGEKGDLMGFREEKTRAYVGRSEDRGRGANATISGASYCWIAGRGADKRWSAFGAGNTMSLEGILQSIDFGPWVPFSLSGRDEQTFSPSTRSTRSTLVEMDPSSVLQRLCRLLSISGSPRSSSCLFHSSMADVLGSARATAPHSACALVARRLTCSPARPPPRPAPPSVASPADSALHAAITSTSQPAQPDLHSHHLDAGGAARITHVHPRNKHLLGSDIFYK